MIWHCFCWHSVRWLNWEHWPEASVPWIWSKSQPRRWKEWLRLGWRASHPAKSPYVWHSAIGGDIHYVNITGMFIVYHGLVLIHAFTTHAYYSNVQRTFKDDKIKSAVFTRSHAMKRHKSMSPILRNGANNFGHLSTLKSNISSTRKLWVFWLILWNRVVLDSWINGNMIQVISLSRWTPRLSCHPVRIIPRVQSYHVVTERTTGRTVPPRTSVIHGPGRRPAERRAPLFGDARYP